MNIWMDLTSSMSVWQDDANGFIRTELEIARALKKAYPELRFSKFAAGSFVEIPQEQLGWLWDTKNVRAAYANAMGRVLVQEVPKPAKEVIFTGLDRAYQYSDKPSRRLIVGLKTASKCLPKVVRAPLKACYSVARAVYRLFFKRKPKVIQASNVPAVQKILYPFQNQDMIFACSWTFSGKEQA